ncbi:uncharacterized protein LY79DRAFT_20895 [Colletotrichum navitas]|uniref:Uncharacterized protein n=1 Tax=Colletotrichum navitas TaxID=681940 RepID=A0AAD8VDD6_9PEZI|nr:uncharacterized protein LY79DRAFT_20895 [Colletotrichum navitas]KAK1600485.1 hypothetical protein LY79DRAFT_20895 [Colletotrichum navitas]
MALLQDLYVSSCHRCRLRRLVTAFPLRPMQVAGTEKASVVGSGATMPDTCAALVSFDQTTVGRKQSHRGQHELPCQPLCSTKRRLHRREVQVSQPLSNAPRPKPHCGARKRGKSLPWVRHGTFLALPPTKLRQEEEEEKIRIIKERTGESGGKGSQVNRHTMDVWQILARVDAFQVRAPKRFRGKTRQHPPWEGNSPGRPLECPRYSQVAGKGVNATLGSSSVFRCSVVIILLLSQWAGGCSIGFPGPEG